MKNVHAFINVGNTMNMGNFCHPTSLLVCEACFEDNHKVTSVNDGENRAAKLMKIAHSGVCDSMRTTLSAQNPHPYMRPSPDGGFCTNTRLTLQ